MWRALSLWGSTNSDGRTLRAIAQRFLNALEGGERPSLALFVFSVELLFYALIVALIAVSKRDDSTL